MKQHVLLVPAVVNLNIVFYVTAICLIFKHLRDLCNDVRCHLAEQELLARGWLIVSGICKFIGNVHF